MEADKVKSKVKLIVSYWESIVGKKFDVIEKDLHTEEGMSEMIRTRNKMAMVIIFQGYWRAFVKFMNALDNDTHLTSEQEKSLFEQLDFLYQIYNADDDFRASFWRGEQPLVPEKMPFFVPDNKGGGENIFIDLNNVKNISI